MAGKSPLVRILEARLNRWRERLATAQIAGDDPYYIAAARVEIERLEDQIATNNDMAKRHAD